MLNASRTSFCIAALFSFVMANLFIIQYWVYPGTVGRPFGQDIFIGATLAIFAIMAAVVYVALRFLMK